MDVVYLYNGTLGLRAPIVTGVSELIHAEGDYTLQATIPAKYKARPGEYLGFRCIDGRFRLFLIDRADNVEDDGTTEITATDAAVAELADSVAENVTLEGKTAEQAARDILAGTGFALGTVTAGSGTGTGEYAYIKRWPALKRVAEDLDVRIIPYYTIEGARITGKRVDVLAKTKVYRGRFFERGRDATGIVVSYVGTPKTVLYGVGKVSGEKETERVTIGGASWSRARGDPVDKPEGQAFVEDAEAIARWGRHEDVYEDKEETDPAKLLTKTWAELQKLKQPEVSAQATISDMEHIRGQEHKAVRMWDWVIIETRADGSVEAQVIAIKRDYIRPNRTKLTIGREGGTGSSRAGLTSQIAALSRETSTIGARSVANTNRSVVNKHLIQLNANAIQLNAETIMAQAELIDLRATKEQVEDLEEGILSRFSEVSITLDAYKALIDLKATREEVTEIDKRVSNAEVQIDAANAKINLKADQTITNELEKRVSAAEVDIDAANALIALKANQTVVDDLTTRVRSAEVDIDAANANIALKAGQSVVDELGNRVSSAEIEIDGLNSEIDLKADKITLNGYVTANQLKTEFTNFESGISDSLYVSALSANNFECSSIKIAGYGMSLKQTDYVKSVGRTRRYVKSPSDVTIEIWEISSISNGTLYYLSWE